MKSLLVSVVLTVSFLAYAGPQQEKMKSCNTQATGKKGEERKAFMKSCLSSEKPKINPQHQKMKDCNAQATGKKGEERKSFMKSCLSGGANTSPTN